MREQHDVFTLIDHAKKIGYKVISLWGRSMGAVTSILCAKRGDIACLVVDSPFSSFKKVKTF